ncbi:unnamed protein product [Urochloa decumbens]|uniref:CCHC-type domain-containing protein n=1 Tax=Urochloa decumbens TaxID=240449 RepID=A0ABC8Z0G6_9POAL
MEEMTNEATPPLSPAGGPPAAIHPTSLLAGDQPAATFGASPRAALSPRGRHSSSGPTFAGSDEEGVDLQKKKKDLRGKAPAQELREVTGRSELRPCASYKEALVGTRTFKPRFDTSRRPEEWNDNSSRLRSARLSVWGRLGPRPRSVHDQLGVRTQLGQQQDTNGFLQILKAKAVGRCFNCLARDHRIASCRDPPRCILCSRSGHKAKYCPGRAPTAVWKRRTATVADAAPAAAAPPTGASRGSTPVVPLSSPMDHIPGEAWRRPERVSACAARTNKVREAERDLQMHALIAVQLDARVQLSCDGVLREALQQLRIPAHALQVSRISASTFLLRFQSPELRNFTRARGAIDVGRTSLHLMPWGRQFGAAAALGTLFYRARICFEGVPGHAHQVESILHLLPKQSLVEGIDHVRVREDEKGCFIVWIWCKDLDALGVLGNLQIEEPMVVPEDSDPMGVNTHSSLRSEAVSVLRYDVLIHLDVVEDYNPPASNSSPGSFGSDASGLPFNDSTVQWPMRHRFDWHLGQPDAMPEPPRASVHTRLGARRDRSPPRDGGSGAFRRDPTPNQFDMSRSTFGGPRSSGQGYNAGRGYQGQHRCQAYDNAKEQVDSLFVNTDTSIVLNKVDPMMEEAVLLPDSVHSPPLLSQRSVEPTAADTVVPMPVTQDEDTRKQAPEVDLVVGEQEVEVPEKDTSPHETPVRKEEGLSRFKDVLTASLDSRETYCCNLFDLNQDCEPPEEGQIQVEVVEDVSQEGDVTQERDDQIVRASLYPTDDRLNKRDHGSHRPSTRGVARLVVPLKKSLLCNPVHRSKTPHTKKAATTCGTVQGKENSFAGGSLDEKAAAFLMKASGIIGANEQPSESAHLLFGNQFTMPMQEDTLGDMRVAFGLPENAGTDIFSALLSDATEE